MLYVSLDLDSHVEDVLADHSCFLYEPTSIIFEILTSRFFPHKACFLVSCDQLYSNKQKCILLKLVRKMNWKEMTHA